MPLLEIELNLKPKFLDSKIGLHLLSEVRKKSEQICEPKLGYILNVKRIVKFENTEDTLFKLLCDVDYYRPRIGDELWGTVCMRTDEGYLATTVKRQKVLVITETEYDIGSELLIKLINVQFYVLCFMFQMYRTGCLIFKTTILNIK